MSEASEIQATIEGAFADRLAQVCQIYGIPAKYGRLYALLFLTPEPLSLSALAERSGFAKSTASTTMRTLERYRFVRRLPRGSDRQDYYEAVTDPNEIFRDWVRMFLIPELAMGEEMVAGLDEGVATLCAAAGYSPEQSAELERRAAGMRGSLVSGQRLIELLGSLGDEPPADS